MRWPFGALALPLLVLWGAAGTAQTETDALPDLPTVTTLAGSGELGIADGPGNRSSFIAPAGIAYGRDGNLYVADREAQRIRVVAPNGDVTTLAGAAPLVNLGIGAGGSFRDGPAAQAYFNMPTAVLPLDDGSVLVADRLNFCIRMIRAGVVSTFAGDRIRGTRDGPRGTAEFWAPMALATDAGGNVYVADPPNGVRKIDRSGNISTLKFAGSRAVIALARVPQEPSTLLVASTSLVQRLDLGTLTVDRPFPLEFTFDYGAPAGYPVNREGLTASGPVSALAAFRDGDFVYTDALDSAVRLGQTTVGGKTTIDYGRVLTAVPPENASLGSAGFRDGPGNQALVDEPLGIAIAADGTVAIADTGNRRIRILSTFNHRTHLSAEDLGTELPAKPDPHEFRIALVGNSYVWWNQGWHESIAGITEDDILKSAHGDRRPKVIPIMRQGIPDMMALNLIENQLSDGVVDMVVLDLSTYAQMGGDGFAGPAYPAGWQKALSDGLAATSKTLRAAGIPLLVIDHPGASDFADEFEYAHIPKGPDAPDTGVPNEPTNVQHFHDEYEAALAASGAPTLDLWPAFLEAYSSVDRQPLFDAWDHHLSLAGRELVATNLARRLLELQPWNAAPHN